MTFLLAVVLALLPMGSSDASATGASAGETSGDPYADNACVQCHRQGVPR